ncbi:MAG: phytoene desaturase family protein [Halobacteriaceae archaeon]
MQPLAGLSSVVVGGGFGGLSAAAYLADRGADVTLLERNDQLGGRAATLERDGFAFDMGPSWYLMPDVFERFFGHFDRRPGEYYSLDHLDPHYRVFWKDGDRADVTGDREQVHEVYEDRQRFRDYVSLDVLRSARGLSLLGTMDDHVAGYFDHPKLRQIMQYSLVFLGGAPYNTPALYNLMSHVDFNLGVYYPTGGMSGVADRVADLARELGVRTVTGTPVEHIDPYARGHVVRTPDRDYRADVVVSDADYAHTELDLLDPEYRQYGRDYWESRTYAPSAFLLYLGVEGDVDPLAHHSLVLPTDWDGHFEQIFEAPAWPDDPAYYVCAASQTDDSVAPEGHSNLFVLVPIAPGLDDGPAVRERYTEQVLADLAANACVDVRDRIVTSETFSVSEFADRYNSYRGTALGLAHTLRQTAPLRPPHRSTELRGLYYTGANTTPGIGVPMCLISGELTADYVEEDFA